ncbi:hypothetical protein [Fodinicola acaciae]|uniref:hypothetical protein n=1 Tax=Fodinicola acaciae TaxID=2681555 RepID=UPI001C9E97E4|nr:hypothetical protein [Fodinicola acaciae]
MRPETAELLDRFVQPAPKYGPLPIWWWSGAPVTRDRLRWQMEQLVAGGVRQAVVLCLAPTGPMFGSVADDPAFLSDEWLRLFDNACADAKELGFTLWLYDQIGFSGANFQGRLIAGNPDFAGQALARLETDGPDARLAVAPGQRALSAYAVLANGERVDVSIVDGAAHWPGAGRLVLTYAHTSGFDYFNEQACASLLDQVHGTLERAVGHWFGSSIGGFFQDELPPMPTWSADFAATFQESYGYDLVPRLWALWEADFSAEAAGIRRDYQEHRARLARRGFFDQHDSWFAERDLVCGFDQASPAREGDPLGGVQIYGDYLGLHRGYRAPGSDHWGDAKVHSSLAHANGHERVWIEAFHSSGWGGTLEETYDWLSPFLRRGANLYDPHAVYYATVGGWWEWAPPSTCWRQPYWPSYHVFAGAVARLCSVLTAGAHVCDVALLSPTANAQAFLTLAGPLPQVDRSARAFRALNGINSWFNQHRGVLEQAGIDHDVLDEATVAAAEVTADGLKIAAETYKTVVVPAATAVHADAARRLVDLVRAGGRVICVGGAPELFLGGNDIAEDFAGRVEVVDAVDDVPDAILTEPVRVRADAPFLHRRHGDTHVLTLTAHDERSGTANPILKLAGDSWMESGFSWQDYNRQLRESGYRFVGLRDRVAQVSVRGLGRLRAQSWSPGTGERVELAVTEAGGELSFEVPFDDGAVALVVLATDLPEPTTAALTPVKETIAVPGPWTATVASTLDNRWGDLANADRTGVLPIEVWRFDHTVSPDDDTTWTPVVASFGPYADVRDDPDGDWRPARWSLARGLPKDPAHSETLGPKGYVPEHFLDWRHTRAGQRVAVRTHLPLPDNENLHLAIGATATRRVWVDGVERSVDGDGHQSFSALPSGRTVEVLLEFTADHDGPLRAYFAVVTDIAGFRRPEWIKPDRQLARGVTADLLLPLRLENLPADTTVHVSSAGVCHLIVNGVEAGRQGDFEPYPEHPEIRVHTYDIGRFLRSGDNEIVLRVGGSAALDSPPHGLAIRSGAHWTGAVEQRAIQRDPHVICQWIRPHPLTGAHWLEPAAAPGEVVVPLVPDREPGGEHVEWLRLNVPPGTKALRVPTDLPVVAVIDGQEVKADAGVITVSGGARTVLLRITAIDGRRGGALLSGPVELTVGEAEFPLVSWEELGLRALGGEVTYRTTVDLPGWSGRTSIDLGEVRGTADVRVNGRLAGQLVWGPWRTEVTDLLRSGENRIEVVVRGTLAGYLDDASPTSGVYAGQVRTGLFGPVTLRRH